MQQGYSQPVGMFCVHLSTTLCYYADGNSDKINEAT